MAFCIGESTDRGLYDTQQFAHSSVFVTDFPPAADAPSFGPTDTHNADFARPFYASAVLLGAFVCLSRPLLAVILPSPPSPLCLPPEIPPLLPVSLRQPRTPLPPDQPTAHYYLCISSLFFRFFSPLPLFFLTSSLPSLSTHC